MTKLWALLIGVNDYPSSPLSGCVPDARALQSYLESDPRLDTDGSLKTLFDAQATKSAIADGILNHLGQARPEDVVLLYFSGHGAQERADPGVWTEERDGCLESIACYAPAGAPLSLMADKELRFLLNQAFYRPNEQSPHLLTIFDCCHSGDNVRSLGLEQEDTRERRFTYVFPQREWSDFLFADAFQPGQLSGAGLSDLIPSPPMVQLAAAKDDQAALEIGGRGVFTSYLIQVLEQTGGSIDYTTLHQLLSNYIRFKHAQHPQFATLGAGMDLLYRGFLNQEVDPSGRRYGRANYSTTEGWLLNMGQMHGLSGGDDAQIQLEGGETIDGKVGEAMDVSSTLDIDFEQRRNLDKAKNYKVLVASMQNYPIHIFIEDAMGEEPMLKRTLTALRALPKTVLLTSTEVNADFVIHFRDGLVYMTRKFDPFRPVFGEVFSFETVDEDSILEKLIGQVQMAARWTFTYSLHNPQLKVLGHPPVGVEVLQEKAGTWGTVQPDGEDFLIDQIVRDQASGKLQARVKVRLTNQFDRPLYLCLLVLSDQCKSVLSVDRKYTPGLVEQPITKLEPGQSLWLFGHRGGVIPYTVGAEEQFQNRPYTQGWFKLLVSTESEIAYDHLIVPRSRMLPDLGGEPVKDWTTQRIGIRILNPNYNTVQEDALKQWLSDPERAPLAAGLYLDTDGLDAKLVLRPEIQLITADQERTRSKSLFWNTLLGAANTWARYQRSRDFKRRLRKFYDRPLMVSEGDSWFQHPTIMEIIDHLSLSYNIFSRGAAGDEMRNYLMSGEYLDAFTDLQVIVQEVAASLGEAPKRPAFFLISGGGNDILGDQFKDFLLPFGEVEAAAPGEKPERFLNQRLQDELDAIMALYRQVFQRLKVAQPEVRIITHGYDYVIPKGLNAEGMSWLGKPMTQQGIKAPEDRQAIVNYLIDTFNERLMAVCEDFDQVTHVDLRGAVKPYQWADEIHPDQEGYQNVALRFSAVIDQML
ncbi:MAG: caspase family protein [Phaeodactylibacter sp.]|uniref:caspase family protein n=1 Tax=Phaeodactylibacter sp. TaxID=1940289 RepID=UPI0032EC807D